MESDKPVSSLRPSRQMGTLWLAGTNYLSLLMAVIQGIVLVPLYLRYIDIRLYGAWLATGNIVAYLGLLDLGFSKLLMQRVGEAYGSEKLDIVGSTIGTGLVILCGLSILPLLLALVLMPWVPGFVHIHGTDAGKLGLAFVLAALAGSLMMMMHTVANILSGLQRQKGLGIIVVLSDLLGTIVLVVLLLLGYGLLSLPLSYIVKGLSATVGVTLHLWRTVCRDIPRQYVRFCWSDARDLFRKSLWQLGANAASTISTQSDSLIAGAFLDPRASVILALTKRASELITLCLGQTLGSVMPALAHLYGETGAHDTKFSRVVRLLINICIGSGIIGVLGYYIFNETFMTLWVGRNFYGGRLLTFLFSLQAVASILMVLTYTLLFATGEVVVVARAGIIEAGVRVPLAILLALVWGLPGIAFAGTFAVVIRLYFHVLRLLVRFVPTYVKGSLYIKPILVQSVIAFGIGVTLHLIWVPSNMGVFLVQGILYVSIVLGCSLWMIKDWREQLRLLFRPSR